MSNKKQTAVDYLVKELSAILGPLETKPMQDLLMVDAINKAKQMEKQQIEDACNQTEFEDIDGMGIHETITKGEQYYKETYGE
jgi:hypothetical protein